MITPPRLLNLGTASRSKTIVPMVRTIPILAAMIGSLLLLPACDDDGNSIMGPCFHTYEDAVIHVQSIRDKDTGSPVDPIFVIAATVEGHPYDLANVEQEENAAGVDYTDGRLRCTPPFSFGEQEGTWRLTIESDEYPEQIVEFDAHYAEFHGGCPSWNDGGTTLDLELWIDWFDLDPFREYARNAICDGIRNRLYLIDDSMVFSDIEGTCPDLRYQQFLWGSTLDDALCYRHDSIAGGRRGCNDTTKEQLFETIIHNPDKPDLGLGPAHTVTEIFF